MKIHKPPMTFKDQSAKEGWLKGVANNQDPYGNACYQYASEWATRMEQAIANGGKIAEIAKPTSHDADDEGITGFMYGCAVNILAKVWIHGEALRLWHNLDTQIGTEGERANESGGILNPALINIEPK
jgi:hypothetical protein